MSLIGIVFNKVTRKNIPVYLATSGPSFWRPTGVISQTVKDLALPKTKAAFEAGKLFEDDDMKNMDQLTVTHMTHESDGDPNPHFSVQGERSDGSKVKGGHVQQDEFKQTQSS